MSSTIKNRILFEDNHLIVVNKEVGELTQGDISGDPTLVDTIKEYLKTTYDKRGNVFLGVIHRLDRPTSGVVVYAKTEKALSRMNALFRDSTAVKRVYWAVVDKLPSLEEGVITHYLKRNAQKNKSTASTVERKGTKVGKLKYSIVAASQSFFLLEIELLTGRHHQIRAQLEAMGSHIKGDLKYGARRSNEDGGIHLHARQISFIHPVKKERLTITAPPFKDPLWDYFYSVAGNRGESTSALG